MANVLLGATGSVAAVRVPQLYDALTAAGHTVKVVATQAATYFFDTASLGNGAVGGRQSDVLVLDEDEWPGRAGGRKYERGDTVAHIELRRWADLFVIAPLDANTLAKLAVGLCDNCLTCVWRAWDTARPIVLAPAMNTLMWQNPFTRKHLRALAADHGAAHIPGHFNEAQLLAAINDRSKTLQVVPPVEKALACGDVGLGAMAEVPQIVAGVNAMLTRTACADQTAS